MKILLDDAEVEEIIASYYKISSDCVHLDNDGYYIVADLCEVNIEEIEKGGL